MSQSDLLLEIGTEELPATFVSPALEALGARIAAALSEARLEHGAVRTLGTPRRLAVIVEAVAEGQPDVARQVTGPPRRAAFDAEGQPTKAAEGFARGQGVPVTDLVVVDTPKGEYVAVDVEETGRPAAEILPELLAGVVAGLPFKKSMRWGEGEASFARPVHWICALHGSRKVELSFGEVTSGARTRGHRFLAPEEITLRAPGKYVARLKEAKVLVDVAERRAAVWDAVTRAAAEVATVALADEALLDEVTQLVEWPVALAGRFDPESLELPREVLLSEMRTHQRYFAVNDAEGRLAPAFVAVSNTPVKDPAVSRHGYERVLAARLADARHFYDRDRKAPLESRVPGLDRVVFQQRLGSVGDKVRRIMELSAWLSSATGHDDREEAVRRVALLCKADLVTGMVGEFPELQGVMGRYYALAGGEPDAVARGIEEHYLPRSAGDALPEHVEGAIVGLADRVDTLAGIFGIGKAPTGTADPFGLRRACLAVVNVVVARGLRFSLTELVGRALKQQEESLTLDLVETRAQVLDFFRGRLRHLWAEDHPVDVVEAVLGAGFDDLLATRERLAALSELKSLPEFSPLAVAFSRAANIVAKASNIEATEVDAGLFVEDAERALWKCALSIREKVERAYEGHDYRTAFQEMVALKEPVDTFFDKVLVMDPDAKVRDNRLLVLSGVADLFTRVADFSRIQTE